MKSTLIPLCASIAALIAVHPAFAEEKLTSPRPSPQSGKGVPKGHKEAKPAGKAVHVASAAAKPQSSNHPIIQSSPRTARAVSPPPQPWVGRTVTISESERHVIRAYVFDRLQTSKGGRFNGVPQGLAKETAWGFGTALPPEWRKSCVRGKMLTAEVHDHCQPLPHEIMVKLPPPPPGTILLAVDGTVLRLGYPTYEILDVFHVL